MQQASKKRKPNDKSSISGNSNTGGVSRINNQLRSRTSVSNNSNSNASVGMQQSSGDSVLTDNNKSSIDLEGGEENDENEASSDDLESLSSDDSDVEVINAPLFSEFPGWLSTRLQYIWGSVERYMNNNSSATSSGTADPLLSTFSSSIQSAVYSAVQSVYHVSAVVLTHSGRITFQLSSEAFSRVYPHLARFMESVIDTENASAIANKSNAPQSSGETTVIRRKGNKQKGKGTNKRSSPAPTPPSSAPPTARLPTPYSSPRLANPSPRTSDPLPNVARDVIAERDPIVSAVNETTNMIELALSEEGEAPIYSANSP